MTEPIIFEYSKSTEGWTHIHPVTDERQEITGLPPQANIKAMLARAMAMGLPIKKERL